MKLIQIFFSPIGFAVGFLTPLLETHNNVIERCELAYAIGFVICFISRFDSSIAWELDMVEVIAQDLPRKNNEGGPFNFDLMTDSELHQLEKKIANKYMNILPWGAVAWGLGNLAVWLSLWPLVILGYIPIWLGFLVASLNVTLSYLPSHEAQHNIIAAEGDSLRWLNELVGHLSVIPLVTPYRVLKITPIMSTTNIRMINWTQITAKTDWHFLWKSILNRQPESGRNNAYPANHFTGREKKE